MIFPFGHLGHLIHAADETFGNRREKRRGKKETWAERLERERIEAEEQAEEGRRMAEALREREQVERENFKRARIAVIEGLLASSSDPWARQVARSAIADGSPQALNVAIQRIERARENERMGMAVGAFVQMVQPAFVDDPDDVNSPEHIARVTAMNMPTPTPCDSSGFVRMGA